MLPSFFLLAAVATATPFAALSERQVIGNYPLTQILPVPGWNSTRDGFNGLAELYNTSAAQLTAQAIALGA
jgi:hypothetical protein